MSSNRLLGAIVIVTVLAAACSGSPPTSDSAATSTTTTSTTAPGTTAAVDTSLSGFSPDLIFHGAQVLTIDDDFTIAEAVAVLDGRITAVGTDEEIIELAGADTVLVDLEGRTLMPGFIDPHTHALHIKTPDPVAMAVEQDRLLAAGTTTVGTPAIIPLNREGYDAMVDRDLLIQRTHLYLSYNSACGEPEPPDGWQDERFDNSADLRLAIVGVKIFTDGGTCGAPAVSFDYLDTARPDLRDGGWIGGGDLYVDAAEVASVVSDVESRNGLVVIHAIGDRGITTALDGIAASLDGAPNLAGHRIDHASWTSLLPTEDLLRFGTLQITPAVQLLPYANACDGAVVDVWRNLIPESPLLAVEDQHPLLDANPQLTISWHSDEPSVPGTPFQQMYSAVTRRAVNLSTTETCAPPGWDQVPTFSVEDTLAMVTANAAKAMGLDDDLGTIEVGKIADLLVLETDPLQSDFEVAIAHNRPLVTMIDAKVVYCDESVAALCTQLPTFPTSQRTEDPPTTLAPVDSDGLAVLTIDVSQVTVSAGAATAGAAVDGDLERGWVAEAGPPQWIEIDLGSPVEVAAIRLHVDQAPEGPTVHRVHGGTHEDPGRELFTLDGNTAWGDVLEIEGPWTFEFFRIETTESPSWVAWLEIELLIDS